MQYIDGMRRGEYGEARTRLAVGMRREGGIGVFVWASGGVGCG